MTPFFTATDGTKLAYQDQGTGLPLLCLSGLTRTMGDFDYLRPHLPQLRLIRMDYRGRGASGHSGAASYTVPQEAADVLALLDHLGVDQAAILGTSRGGLIAMYLAAVAKPRLMGLCLNDVGPVIERDGLDRIAAYLGKNPNLSSHEDMAMHLFHINTGFLNVPKSRWMQEARLHYRPSAQGLRITYDPTLRDAFLATFNGPEVDLWPLFDACAGLPMALLRAENSDLLSPLTMAEMQRRRPDMLCATVPDRGHVPFLDEPKCVDLIDRFLRSIEP